MQNLPLPVKNEAREFSGLLFPNELPLPKEFPLLNEPPNELPLPPPTEYDDPSDNDPPELCEPNPNEP